MRNHKWRKERSKKNTKSLREEFPVTLECVSEVMTLVRLNGAKEYIKLLYKAESRLWKLTLKSPIEGSCCSKMRG